MNQKHLFPAFALLLSAPAYGAGMEPVPLGADGPWIAIPAGTPVDIGPLSPDAIAALADLDGDPAVTSERERAMMLVLRQVLGLPPVPDAPD